MTRYGKQMTAKILKSETLLRIDRFDLAAETVRLSNGTTTTQHVLRHPGSAAIVPLAPQDRVVLIKQYRQAFNGYIWEIPAGTREIGETALACAQRELGEEAGLQARTWTSMGTITPVPGYSDERLDLYLASDLTIHQQRLDGDEQIDIHELSWGEAIDMIGSGRIQDAKTIAGLLMADRWFKGRRT